MDELLPQLDAGTELATPRPLEAANWEVVFRRIPSHPSVELWNSLVQCLKNHEIYDPAKLASIDNPQEVLDDIDDIDHNSGCCCRRNHKKDLLNLLIEVVEWKKHEEAFSELRKQLKEAAEKQLKEAAEIAYSELVDTSELVDEDASLSDDEWLLLAKSTVQRSIAEMNRKKVLKRWTVRAKKWDSWIDDMLFFAEDKVLKYQCRLIFSAWFLFWIAVSLGFLAQGFYVLQTHAWAHRYKQGLVEMLIFIILPPMIITICWLLHLDFTLMTSTFNSTLVSRYRATLFISGKTIATFWNDKKDTKNAEEQVLYWIDFLFHAFAPFVLSSCFFGIIFTWIFGNNQYGLGAIVTGLFLFFLAVVAQRIKIRRCMLKILMVVYMVVFVVALVGLPVGDSWEMTTVVSLIAMIWAACIKIIGVVSELFISIVGKWPEVDQCLDLLNIHEIQPGRMSRRMRNLEVAPKQRQQEQQEQQVDNTPQSCSRFRRLFGRVVPFIFWFLALLAPFFDQYFLAIGLLLAVVFWFSWYMIFEFHLVETSSCFTILIIVVVIFGAFLSIFLRISSSTFALPEGEALMHMGDYSSRVSSTPYLACETMWGSNGTGPIGLGLSVLDMAALSQYAYSSNKSHYKELLNASFGPTASSIWFDEYDELPRIVGTLFRSRTGANHTIVLAIRGTGHARDWLADFSMFSVVAALQASSFIMQVISLLPNEGLAGVIKLVNLAKDEEESYRDRVSKVFEIVSRRFPGAAIYFTGHSLGGTFAAQAGARLHKRAVVFSAPGQRLSRSRFGFTREETYRNVLNIVPDFDLVPYADYQDAVVQRILCKDSDRNSPKFRGVQCHMLEQTICELWRACGDVAGRNFNKIAGWSKGVTGIDVTCDWDARSQYHYITHD